MRTKIRLESNPVAAALLSVAVAVSLAACGGGTGPQPQEKPVTDAPPAVDAARAAELEARSQQLAQREAELAAKEQELENDRQQAAAEAAEREREAAAKDAAKAAAARKAAIEKTAPPKGPTATPARTEAAKAAPAPSPEPIEVPAGTQLTVALSSDLSTKTAKPGDAFEARLVSDLMINDRRVLPAGTRATGTVSAVVSGSDKIGTVPTLGLTFDHLELADGQRIPISGQLTQLGKSEKGRDVAKIIGGVAAGAIVGSQVKKGGTGTIVGGLLGGAAGAVVAKNTGTEVQLADGSTLTITLDQAIKVVAN
ncbi:MAG: hypothetical protein AB7N70_37805 [Dehalococcoidia bacterium]